MVGSSVPIAHQQLQSYRRCAMMHSSFWVEREPVVDNNMFLAKHLAQMHHRLSVGGRHSQQTLGHRLHSADIKSTH